MNAGTSRFSAGRAIHLIDVENLCGASLPTCDQIREARRLYELVIPIGPTDHVVVASAHASLLAVGAGWPGARYLVRSGKDGADICLANVMLDEALAERYELIYVASGDGGLAPFVAELGRRGAHTVAVSRIQAISPHMRLAAVETVYLPRNVVVLSAIA